VKQLEEAVIQTRQLGVDTALLSSQGLLRKERIIGQRRDVEVCIDGKWLVNFCSNDYLGLSSHPRIQESMIDAVTRYGTGSSASPLVSGKSKMHEELEHKLALITGRDRALLLSCGYMANLAIQSALAGSSQVVVVEDRLCHASIVDGSMISRNRFKRFAHASPAALEKVLIKYRGQPILVLTESVFSMDGDIAPLIEISDLCSYYQACLVVDDAHGFGVIGKHGLGGTDYFGLEQKDVPLIMATFGKALGGYGAFVAGSKHLIESLVQRARPYIYSTALPVPVIAAASTALDLLTEDSGPREHLHSLMEHFHRGLKVMGIDLPGPTSPIFPIIIGDAGLTVELSRMLESQGLFVSAIRPPTVPRNSSRLRITLSAGHTYSQVDRLLEALELCLNRAGVLHGS
jgi:8-amino-7-oxononanoate synthase